MRAGWLVLGLMAAVRVHAAEPATLAEALHSVEAQRWAEASVRLHALRAGPSSGEERGALTLHLARSLEAQGLSTPAQDLHAELVGEGPRSELFDEALVGWVRLAAHEAGWSAIAKVGETVPAADWPSEARAELGYAVGLAALRERAFVDADTALGSVPAGHSTYLRATYLRGVAAALDERPQDAGRHFLAVVRADVRRGDDGGADLRERAVLGLARQFYALQRLDQAEAVYRQIPEDSPHWAEATRERMWIAYWRDDAEAGERLFQAWQRADADPVGAWAWAYLQGLTFAGRCGIGEDGASAMAARFAAVAEQTGPWREAARRWLNDSQAVRLARFMDASSASDGAGALAVARYERQDAEDAVLDARLRERVEARGDVQVLRRALARVEREVRVASHQPSWWREALGPFVSASLAARRTALEERLGLAVLDTTLDRYRTLETLMRDAEQLNLATRCAGCCILEDTRDLGSTRPNPHAAWCEAYETEVR